MSPHPPVDDLSAFLDGELPGDRVASVEAHLRTCTSCASWLDDVRASESLVGPPPADAPPGYHETFVARLRPRLATRGVRRPWIWSAAAAAALLAVVLAPAVLREQTSLAPAPAPARDEIVPRAPAPAPEARENAAPPPLQAAKPADQELARAGAGPPPAAPAELHPRQPEPKRQVDETGERADFAEPPQKKKDAPPAPAATAMTQSAEADHERALPSEVVPGAVGKLEEAAPAPAATPAPGFADDRDGAREQQKAAANQGRAEGRLAAGAPAATTRSRESEIADLRRQRDALRREGRDDEARVRVVDLGLRIYRLSGADSDRRQALADADAYLAAPESRAQDRVRSLRRQIEP
jgi:hypothetical protein